MGRKIDQPGLFSIFFSAAVSATNNPISDLNRENCLQRRLEKIKIMSKFPNTESPEKPKPSFSAPKIR